ncbi:DUF6216 family protein [Pseudomonas sp. A6]|uniref:DUF6216 family protein n=1 Tax=Pseudomonas sp. A6 TaxID=410021 RepID=UPI004025CEC5
MTPSDFFSTASKAKELLTGLTPAIIMAFIFFYVRARAGSSDFLHDRLWRILGGKKSFHNQEFANELEKVSDHEKFNYKTGIRFPSHKKAEETLSWLRKNSIGLEELIKIRTYFDQKEISIRRPSLKSHNFFWKFAMAIFIFTSAIFLASWTPAALLTIKKTETMVWASEDSIRSFNIFQWKITPELCHQKEAPINEHDYDIACQILEDANRQEFLNKSIATQRLTGFLFWALGWLIIFGATREYVIAKTANRIYEKLKDQDS